MVAAAPSDRVPVRALRPTLRHAVEFLAQAHGVAVDPAELDAVERRLAAQGPTTALEALRALATQAGLATATVMRPLGEVLRDADPAFPWLALRGEGDAVEAVLVLRGRRAGAEVAVPGVHARASRWSKTALAHWLGLSTVTDVATWVVAEPAAPLASLRTPTPGTRRDPFSRIRALLKAERRSLWIAVVYSAVIGLLALVVPITVQLLVNTIAFGTLLQPLVVLMLVVFVALGFSTALNALRATVVEVIQRSIFARVATDVTWRLLRVRVEAFDRYHGPELVNRFFDTVTVQKSAALLLIDGLSITMQTVIGMVLLALYHPFLLAFDALLVTAMGVIIFVLGRGAVGTAIKESKAKYALEAWLEQLAAHLVTFKSAGADAYATRRSHRLLDDYLTYRAKHFKILLRQVLGSFALQAVASSALLGIGGWLVINRQLTLGQLVASEIIVTLMVSAFTKFGKQLEVFYDLCAAIDKLGDLIDIPLERNTGEGRLAAPGPLGVSMHNVEVRYEDSVRPALTLSHLTIAPGARFGITGANGSGKSTLADVLFGLRTPAAGVVQVGGVDVRDLSPFELRQRVALVRGIELFPASILDNVRLGRDEITHDEITAALDAVGLAQELAALPQGLDTLLHPHGRPLSYRQACRLMVARAIVGRPSLLVIDSLLDHIDQPAEQARLDAVLFDPQAPWTLVCIASRPSVLARCSEVVTLRDGQARESTA